MGFTRVFSIQRNGVWIITKKLYFCSSLLFIENDRIIFPRKIHSIKLSIWTCVWYFSMCDEYSSAVTIFFQHIKLDIDTRTFWLISLYIDSFGWNGYLFVTFREKKFSFLKNWRAQHFKIQQHYVRKGKAIKEVFETCFLFSVECQHGIILRIVFNKNKYEKENLLKHKCQQFIHSKWPQFSVFSTHILSS